MAKTILIVDDDEDARNIIVTMVKSLGYDTLSFGSGKDALEDIDGKHIDLALLDIMMPEMNGYELLGHIKDKEEFENLEVIMVTAKDKDSEVLEGYSHGADYYITKPFTKKQLEYGINLFLDK